MGLLLSTGHLTPKNSERRRRPRLPSQTTGWLLPADPIKAVGHAPADEEGWEVRVLDVSRLGTGFVSTEPMQLNSKHRLRIGLGPIKRARLVRVVCCRENADGTYSVGAEFVDEQARHARAA